MTNDEPINNEKSNGNIGINVEGDVTVGGDVIGRDKIEFTIINTTILGFRIPITIGISAALFRAGQITWQHKKLWILGVLSYGLGTSGLSIGAGIIQALTSRDYLSSSSNYDEFLNRFGIEDSTVRLILFSILVGITLITVLSIFGRAMLIDEIRQVDEHERASLQQAFGMGLRKFWTFLGIGFIALYASLTMLAVSFSFIFSCLFPLGVFGLFGAVLIFAIGFFAQIATIFANLSFGSAFAEGYRVVKHHYATIILLGIVIIFVITVVQQMLSMPMTLGIFAPLVVAGVLQSPDGINSSELLATLALFGIPFQVFLIILGGIGETWFMTTFVLTYKEFSRLAQESRSTSILTR